MNQASKLPPQGFFARIGRLGPGMLLAAAAIGSGELILTPRAGAMYGLSIGWVIVVSIVYKLALTLGLARYTIATGEDIFEGFSRLPGPRNWLVWILAIIFLLGAAGYSGIALACGSALTTLFPSLSMIEWAIVVVVAILLLLLKGAYGPVEKIAIVLALTLLAGVFYSLSVFHPRLDWILREAVPRFPRGSGQTLISLLGWTAGGTSTLLYSFWILEKGYALPRSGPKAEPDPSRTRQFRLWLSLAGLDAGLSYLAMIFVSLAFLMIGAIALGSAGPGGTPLVPAKEETMALLSRMLTSAAGPQALYVFLVAALAILWSTILGLIDGKSRAIRTAIRISVPGSRRWSDLAWYRFGVSMLCLVMFALLFTGEPVALITVVSAIEAPVLSLAAVMLMYLLDTRLDRAYRPGVVWHLVIVLGTLAYVAVFIDALIATIAGLQA
ncbi:MAG: Nramp family divalent metal transporter [Thermoguttaceae bacterium]